MAKLNRERKLLERRMEKKARKEARKRAAANGEPFGISDPLATDASQAGDDDAQPAAPARP